MRRIGDDRHDETLSVVSEENKHELMLTQTADLDSSSHKYSLYFLKVGVGKKCVPFTNKRSILWAFRSTGFFTAE